MIFESSNGFELFRNGTIVALPWEFQLVFSPPVGSKFVSAFEFRTAKIANERVVIEVKYFMSRSAVKGSKCLVTSLK